MPNVFYNQGETYWCSLHYSDIEPDDLSCEERSNIDKTCKSCIYCEKQSYQLITKDERFKKFI